MMVFHDFLLVYVLGIMSNVELNIMDSRAASMRILQPRSFGNAATAATLRQHQHSSRSPSNPVGLRLV